jgi:DNA invertase Pin-like site-specific DNA recombinase
MMADIRAGKVNCVLVKDLSRFGRDYIEAGRLIQKTFPALNVRFIAVTDGFDSLFADRTDNSLILPVKNFVNDSYCRDISIKVKAQQTVKRKEGKCISAFTVYGYKKNPEDKNSLIIDEYAADIVRKIFAWKIAGMSMAAIAEKLNATGILSPMEYKRSLGMKYHSGFEGSSTPKWAAVSVKRILVNPMYLGTMVQGKQEKINYKVKKRIDKPREEWVYVENTHEAIVSDIDFLTVQDLLKFDGRASNHTDTANLFSGILICADCKAPMVKRINSYKGTKKVFYICQTKNKSMGCSRHSIEEGLLKRIVFKEIKKYLELMASYEETARYLEQMNVNYDQVVEYDSQIASLQAEYSKYYALKSSLFSDLKEGLIDKKEFDEFHQLYERKCNELENAVTAQKKIIKDMFQNGVAAIFQLEKLKENLDIQELDRELLVTAIRRVFIHEDKRLEIEFRFHSEIDKPGVLSRMYHEKTSVQEVV